VSALTGIIRDGGIITWRNLVGMRRVPDALVALTIQPIMFVALFALIFAGSLGGDVYREFLIAGIFAQTVAFNSAFTTIGLANDLQKGIIDRFRSLPMSRLAVILGRTTSDLGVTSITLVIMSLTGLVVGWRINSSAPEAAAGFALLLLFSFAMSWIGAFIGLSVRNVEVAQSGLAAADRGVEPGHRGGAGLPAAVRQPDPAARVPRAGGLAGTERGPLHRARLDRDRRGVHAAHGRPLPPGRQPLNAGIRCWLARSGGAATS
jgi:hypothetical protein